MDHSDRAGGISHQAKLGLRLKRKHFFSQVDPASADAVHRDAEVVEYSTEDVCLAIIFLKSLFGSSLDV